MIRSLVLVAGVLVASNVAHAEPPREEKIKYSVFDLAVGYIPLAQDGSFTDDVIVAGEAPGICHTHVTKDGVLVVTSDAAKTCPMFSSRTPGSFTARYKNNGADVVASVDLGGYGTFSGTATRKGDQLAIGGLEAGMICVASFSTQSNKWVAVDSDAKSGKVQVEIGVLDVTGSVYVRYGKCPTVGEPIKQQTSAVLKVDFPSVAMRDLGDTNFCAFNGTFHTTYLNQNNPEPNYTLCIDQANAAGQARIIHDIDHYVQQYSWGRLAIRHWPTVIPTVTINGALVSIRPPGLLGGTPDTIATVSPILSASSGFTLPPSSDGQGVASRVDNDGSVVSEVFIPPHAPGTMHIDIRFLDPDSKPKAETALDVIVDTDYAGAIRVGVAHDFFVHEHTYRKLQRLSNGPTEIVDTEGEPSEVFLGYALFPCGRSYGFKRPWYRDLGLLVGFGAVAYAPKQPVEFLRSLYVGLDIEVSRHISFGITGVLHRTSELVELTAGGPAPQGDFPTKDGVEAGLAVVLTLSPDFIKVAAGSGGQ